MIKKQNGSGGRKNFPPRKGGKFQRNFDPDFHFKKDIRKDILEFLSKDEESLRLEPMNSYKRRIAHELAKEYGLDSNSDGEDEERHNVLTRTEETYTPTEDEIFRLTHHDFGDEEFFVVQGKEGIEISLYKDGSFGIIPENPDTEMLDRQIITDGSFKIKNNKIIDFHSVDW